MMPDVNCERCGEPLPGVRRARLPWCSDCVALLGAGEPGDVELRQDYRRDYQRVYQRALRARSGRGARPKWEVTSEGRALRVTLRRRDARVVATGAAVGIDAARRLLYGVLGAAPGVETMSGGGQGSRRQSRFRIVASLGAWSAEELERTMAALVEGGGATRVRSFSEGES